MGRNSVGSPFPDTIGLNEIGDLWIFGSPYKCGHLAVSGIGLSDKSVLLSIKLEIRSAFR